MYRNAVTSWEATSSEKRTTPGRIRTADPQIRNLLLYPAELRGL